MTVEEFAARYRVKLEVEPIPQPVDATFDGDWYLVTLYTPRGAFRENYGLGYGLAGQQPTLDDVLADMASNARDQEDCTNWRDFAAEYGYGNDPESAKKIFKVQRDSVRRLRDVLGDKAMADLRETDYV